MRAVTLCFSQMGHDHRYGWYRRSMSGIAVNGRLWPGGRGEAAGRCDGNDLVIHSLDPTGTGRTRWIMRSRPTANAFVITAEFVHHGLQVPHCTKRRAWRCQKYGYHRDANAD